MIRITSIKIAAAVVISVIGLAASSIFPGHVWFCGWVSGTAYGLIASSVR